MPLPSASQIMNLNRVHRKSSLHLTPLDIYRDCFPTEISGDSLTIPHCTDLKKVAEFLGYSSYLPSEWTQSNRFQDFCMSVCLFFIPATRLLVLSHTEHGTPPPYLRQKPSCLKQRPGRISLLLIWPPLPVDWSDKLKARPKWLSQTCGPINLPIVV